MTAKKRAPNKSVRKSPAAPKEETPAEQLSRLVEVLGDARHAVDSARRRLANATGTLADAEKELAAADDAYLEASFEMGARSSRFEFRKLPNRLLD